MKAWIPHLLTLSRLFLMPLCLLFLDNHFESLALALYVFLALTDYWDGYLARRWKTCSSLGIVLDQVSDKLVGLGFFTGLYFLGLCPIWFVVFSFGLALFLGVGYLLSQLVPTSAGAQDSLKVGKWSMAFQFIWIGWIILWQMVSHQLNLTWNLKSFFEAGFMLLALFQIIAVKSYCSRFLKDHPNFFKVLFSEEI